MSTSGYYDEIAKVEALRRQRLWRLRKRRVSPAVRAAGHTTKDQSGAVSAPFKKRRPA